MGNRTAKPVVRYEDVVGSMSDDVFRYMQAAFAKGAWGSTELTQEAFCDSVYLRIPGFPPIYSCQVAAPLRDKWGAEVAERLFQVMCTNGKAVLSWEEFAYGAWVCACGKQDQRMLLLFRMFDRDNDEKVTKDDLESTLAAITCKGGPFEDAVAPAEATEVGSRSAAGAAGRTPPLIFLLQSGLLFDMYASRDETISFPSFKSWAETDSEMLAFVQDLGGLVGS